MQSERPIVIIVGAGIAGASIAYFLRDRAQVIIMDKEEFPGIHATGRSAAVYYPPHGSPLTQLLSRASRDFLGKPPDGFVEGPILRSRQLLCIAREDQLTTLRSKVSGWDKGQASILSGRAARAHLPILDVDRIAAAAVLPDFFDIDVDRLHQGFLRASLDAGARLLLGTAVERMDWSNEHWRISTGKGDYHCDIVVNAAGAWADEVGLMAGSRALGLIAKRRTVVSFDGPPGADCRDWPFVLDADEEFYMKPEGGRLMASPCDCDPLPPGDVHADEIDVATAVHRVMQATTLEISSIRHRWSGLRTFARDEEPVIGFDPVLPRFFWSVGQGGAGLQSAPAWGRAAASLLRDGQMPEDLISLGVSQASVAPARFYLGGTHERAAVVHS